MAASQTALTWKCMRQWLESRPAYELANWNVVAPQSALWVHRARQLAAEYGELKSYFSTYQPWHLAFDAMERDVRVAPRALESVASCSTEAAVARRPA